MTQCVSPLGTETYVYDNYNWLTDQKLDSVIYSHVNYDSFSRIDNAIYPAAGQQKLQLGRDTLGRQNAYTYTLGNGTTTVSDTVSKTQGNQMTSDVVASGANNLSYTYGYDTAGRLTGATIGSNTYTYSYGTQDVTTCGTGNNKNSNAGKDGNRTSQTVNGVTTYFCYDYADRLFRSSSSLYNTPVYDSRGNIRPAASPTTRSATQPPAVYCRQTP